ncbi:MAG: hypothetical protein PHD88_08200 [Firmicutes bacterium]|nr:hypothetical protein [Bacillota bacterium]MDD4263459.1 hypothetical protein [Bacillota bacterium]MDD4694358.1 hypothetical protein [Bacillota bacterium]
MLKRILVGLTILLFSVSSLATFNIGFRLVISGSVLPSLVMRYEHSSGHGLELTTGVIPNTNFGFILRGEIGYIYRYKNLLVGIGRGITRHGVKGLPIFDDHIKIGYTKPLSGASLDLGGTLSLGTTGQGLALWGGINKQY